MEGFPYSKRARIVCGDQATEDHLYNNPIFKADRIDVPGGMKTFLNPKYQELGLEFIETYVKAHGVDTLVIAPHTHCAAYAAELGEQDEVDFYTPRVQELVQAVQNRLPDLKIETYLLDTESGETTTLAI